MAAWRLPEQPNAPVARPREVVTLADGSSVTAIFNLPVDRMREGYYSDKYFVRAREVLLAWFQPPVFADEPTDAVTATAPAATTAEPATQAPVPQPPAPTGGE